MIRRANFYIICFLFLALFLWGCPKKVSVTIPERLPPRDPIAKLLENFSSAEVLTARTSIRIHTIRKDEEMNFLLNGFLLYRKPNQVRLLGYHPFGMGLFDALYRNGEFFLLVIPQKRVYTGEISQFEDLVERAGPVEISYEKPAESKIPNRIKIYVVEKETRIDLRLKEIVINSSLPEDTFQWNVPQGVEVVPLAQLLKKKRLR